MLVKAYIRIKTLLRNQNRMNVLRADNPTCRIETASLHNVRLAYHNAVLSGTALYKVTMGNCSYISNNSKLTNVEIRQFCSIGPGVQIGLGPHPSKIFVSTYPAFYTNDNHGCPKSFRNDKIFDDSIPLTIIESDVWIGANVLIPGGIKIGVGAIVAAGAVVVKDVPAYAIVGGNPAQIIRYRFSDDHIKLLLESRWWDWPLTKILDSKQYFSDVGKFIKWLGK